MALPEPPEAAHGGGDDEHAGETVGGDEEQPPRKKMKLKLGRRKKKAARGRATGDLSEDGADQDKCAEEVGDGVQGEEADYDDVDAIPPPPLA